MLFNSYIFIFCFLPITLAIYFLFNRLEKYTFSKVVLIIASLVFYGYFNPSYLWIILSSVIINYCINLLFRKKQLNKKYRKLLFVIGLVFNVGLIVFYKYLNFIISGINGLFKTDLIYLNLILPLGISFFTFQQISYLVDSYRGEVPDYSFIDYSLFVTFFPQLIAGPIVLHNEIIPQFLDNHKKKLNYENFSKGIYLFSWGLAKKVLVADNFGKIVTYGYGNISNITGLEAIFAIFAYTLQIYFDFSGYCDMASGIALMFNIELPINFDSPYRAINISDFWKRWHKTLTRFLTKYIYFPLGGSKCSKLRNCCNVLIVFLVSGIWHGAGLTFIFWGMLHGVAMVFYRLFKNQINKIPNAILWFLNFIFVSICWVFFRADTIADGFALINKVFDGNYTLGFELEETLLNIIPVSIITNIIQVKYILPITVIVLMCVFVYLSSFSENIQNRAKNFKPTILNYALTLVILIYSILSLSGVSTFLYFNF